MRQPSTDRLGPSTTAVSDGATWGVFARIMTGQAAEAPDHKTISIDATYLKSAPHSLEPAVKNGGRGRLIGRTKGGMNHCPTGDLKNHR